MRFLVWLGRALIFFSLFAFALNNQHPVSLNWFFGYGWTAPLVMVVLAAFAGGAVFGVLAMAPQWWRQRQRARHHVQTVPAPSPAETSPRQTNAPVLPPDGI